MGETGVPGITVVPARLRDIDSTDSLSSPPSDTSLTGCGGGGSLHQEIIIHNKNTKAE